MKETLNEILQRMLSTVDAGVAFLSAEIPDVIQQLLVWKAVSSGLFFLFFFSIFLITAAYAVKTLKGRDKEVFKKHWHSRTRQEESYVEKLSMTVVITSIISVVSLIITLLSYTWLKIIIAPKVYLIEYAASLIK